jgi:hypothetical protein
LDSPIKISDIQTLYGSSNHCVTGLQILGSGQKKLNVIELDA